MAANTMLCVDSESLHEPAMLGLPDENLRAQEWLDVFSDAVQARSHVRTHPEVEHIWVFSSDTMDGLNLAASLVAEAGGREVVFLSFEGSGSLLSRCDAAGVRAVFGAREFLRIYGQAKLANLEGMELDDADVAALERGSKSQRETQARRALPATVKAAVERDPEHDCSILAVVSGSGGSGKSTLTACLAEEYRLRGLRVAVLDADFQFGDLDSLLEGAVSIDAIDLIEHPERIASFKVDEGRLCVVRSPARIEQSELIAPRMGALVDLLAGPFDVVLVNTSNSWGDSHIQLIERAGKTVYLLDQRPASVRSCQRVLDLCARCGIALQPFVFALNFTGKSAPITSLDAACALKGVSVKELKDGGGDVSEFIGAGLLADLMASDNAYVQSVSSFAQILIPDAAARSDGSHQPHRQKKPFFHFGRRRVACL